MTGWGRRNYRGNGRRISRPIGCLLWLIVLLVVLIVVAVIFGGFQLGTKAAGSTRPPVPVVTVRNGAATNLSLPVQPGYGRVASSGVPSRPVTRAFPPLAGLGCHDPAWPGRERRSMAPAGDSTYHRPMSSACPVAWPGWMSASYR